MLRILVAVAVAVLMYRVFRGEYDPSAEEPGTGKLPAAAVGVLVALAWPWSLVGALVVLVAWRQMRRPARRVADPRRIAELEAALAVPLDEVIEQIERRLDRGVKV